MKPTKIPQPSQNTTARRRALLHHVMLLSLRLAPARYTQEVLAKRMPALMAELRKDSKPTQAPLTPVI